MTALLGKQKRRPFCHMAPLCRRPRRRTKPRCGGTRPSSAGHGVPPTGMAFLRRVLRPASVFMPPRQGLARLARSEARPTSPQPFRGTGGKGERGSGRCVHPAIRPIRKIRQINRALMPPCSSGASTPQPHRDRRGRPAGGAPAEGPAAFSPPHPRRGHRPRP